MGLPWFEAGEDSSEAIQNTLDLYNNTLSENVAASKVCTIFLDDFAIWEVFVWDLVSVPGD